MINKLFLVEVTGLFWKPHHMFLANDFGMFLFDVNIYVYIYIYLSEYVYQLMHSSIMIYVLYM